MSIVPKLLAANWKANPILESDAVKLAKASDAKHVVVCPPFPFLGTVGKALKRAALGAQDAFWEEKGAYTGEVSPMMLKKMGAEYVILGHSERRRWVGETDEMINKKVKASLAAGLKVILCVGEAAGVRRKGFAAAQRFAEHQLRQDILGLSSDKLLSKLIVAYEPVWAISTNPGSKPDDPKDSAEMIRFIKNYLKPKTHNLKPKVLYGGSVTSSNVGRIFSYNEIDGALVGGASLKIEEFKKIIAVGSKS